MNPSTRTVRITIILHIHNPSRHKRKVLDHVLGEYTNAQRELAQRAEPLLAELLCKCAFINAKGTAEYRPWYLMSGLYKLRCPSFAKLPSALRLGLCEDVAQILLGYVAQKRINEKTKFPFRGKRKHNRQMDPLEQLVHHPLTLQPRYAFRNWRDTAKRQTPIHFAAPYFPRSCDLQLHQLENQRWAVTVPLLPRKIGKTHTKFNFALAFSQGQREWLERGTPKVARLVKRADEYALHVALAYRVEIQPTRNFLGVDRGVFKRAACAVVDGEGRVLESFSGGHAIRTLQIERGRAIAAQMQRGKNVHRKHFRQARIQQTLHELANHIVARAKQQHARIVLEDLNLTTKGRFTQSEYAKLAFYLTYKALFAGLPKPLYVFAQFSSQICCVCGGEGERDPDNRESFACPECETVCDADINAAINIARRAMYRKRAWEQRGGYRAFHQSFVRLQSK